jgi:hypothetical protein
MYSIGMPAGAASSVASTLTPGLTEPACVADPIQLDSTHHPPSASGVKVSLNDPSDPVETVLVSVVALGFVMVNVTEAATAGEIDTETVTASFTFTDDGDNVVLMVVEILPGAAPVVTVKTAGETKAPAVLDARP